MNFKFINQPHWIGFILSIFLTSIPFYIIQYQVFKHNILLAITICCAIAQVYIHLIYFLHLGHMPHLAWNIISLIFTIFIVFVLVIGSLWIMIHLHHNLMT